jgi:Clostridium P-47 protein
MSSDIASTLGWDTVFAVHIADLNEVIAARKTSPAGFSATDAEDAISVTGKFGTWQIVPGGSGGLLWMKVPFRDTVLTMSGKAQPPRSGTATIQLRLRFLDQDAGAAAPGAPRALKLTVQTQAASSDEPAVTILDPPGIVYDGETPRFMERTALETLLDIWMNSHLDEFQHVFATVDINAVAAHDGFQWLQPTHVDYAYCDLGQNDGLLAVLCMTEGRSPRGLAQQVVAAAIPAGQRAGFLISKRRLLRKLVLPIMPQLFPGSRASDYDLSESDEAIVTTTPNVAFTVKTSDGVTHNAQLMNFQLSLTGEEITFGMVTKTDVSPGIRAHCRAENFLGVRLVNAGGVQTLAFYDVRPQIVTKWSENDPGFGITEIILGVIAVIALAIAAVATAGTALAVAALVIGLLAGAAAGGILLTKTIIDQIGTDNAPSIGTLAMNSTAPITWTGDKAFRLTSAGLNDSMQLGGVMVPAGS